MADDPFTDMLRTYPPEDLQVKLKRLKCDFEDAIWLLDSQAMSRIRREIELVEGKLACGETHDYPF